MAAAGHRPVEVQRFEQDRQGEDLVKPRAVQAPLIAPTGPALPSQRHTTPVKPAQTPSPTDFADPLGYVGSGRMMGVVRWGRDFVVTLSVESEGFLVCRVVVLGVIVEVS